MVGSSYVSAKWDGVQTEPDQLLVFDIILNGVLADELLWTQL